MASFTYEDTELLLARLGATARSVVVVGGQAVNFWAERYVERVPELAAFGPFTSKDVDLLGDVAALRACAFQLRGTSREADPWDPSPNTGVVVFHDHLGNEQTLDMMREIFGLDGSEVFDMSLLAEVEDPQGHSTGVVFRVMHPVHCVESRACNIVALPGYDDDRSKRQLRASVLSLRQFLLDVLAEPNGMRHVLNLSERVFRFCLNNFNGRRVFAKTGIDPFDAVPNEPPMPTTFLEKRYPQMKERLARRRRTAVR